MIVSLFIIIVNTSSPCLPALSNPLASLSSFSPLPPSHIPISRILRMSNLTRRKIRSMSSMVLVNRSSKSPVVISKTVKERKRTRRYTDERSGNRGEKRKIERTK